MVPRTTRPAERYNLPVLSPVDESGRFTDSAPRWLAGQQVFAANPVIVERLERLRSSLSPAAAFAQLSALLAVQEAGDLPSDRAVVHLGRPQRPAKRTLKAIGEVHWLPSWGRTRIEAMVSLRPDWCISRQRSWGVPIPALGCTSCHAQLLSAETVRHFRDLFRAEGADAWFTLPVEELLPPGAACPQCGGTSFRKEGDILDVWFESGSSHRAVLGKEFDLGFPAFMYLEGSDQHRGWFQSSILTAVGTKARAIRECPDAWFCRR